MEITKINAVINIPDSTFVGSYVNIGDNHWIRSIYTIENNNPNYVMFWEDSPVYPSFEGGINWRRRGWKFTP